VILVLQYMYTALDSHHESVQIPRNPIPGTSHY
jgi:hypothetical protein